MTQTGKTMLTLDSKRVAVLNGPHMIEVSVTQGSNLLSLRSGTVTFARSRGAVLKIGGISAQFDVEPFTEGPFALTRIPVPETVTFIYKFAGTMPFAPFGRFALEPENIGTIAGQKVFVWWHLARMNKDSELMQLHFEVYVETPATVK